MSVFKFWKDLLDLWKDYAPVNLVEGTGVRLKTILIEKYEQLINSYGKEFDSTIEGELKTIEIKSIQELEDFILGLSEKHLFKDIDVKDFLNEATITIHFFQEAKTLIEKVEEVVDTVPEVVEEKVEPIVFDIPQEPIEKIEETSKTKSKNKK